MLMFRRKSPAASSCRICKEDSKRYRFCQAQDTYSCFFEFLEFDSFIKLEIYQNKVAFFAESFYNEVKYTKKAKKRGLRLVGKYIVKRILSGVITILILITACFFLMHAIPGSPFSKGEQGVPEAVMQRLNEKYGLDQPLYVQYFRSGSDSSRRFRYFL